MCVSDNGTELTGTAVMLLSFAINGLMQGGLATALLEFLARSAWARVVPSNLRHCAAESRRAAKWVVVKESLGLEITVNPHRARRRTHNQRLAKLRANWMSVGSHLGIGIVFIG